MGTANGLDPSGAQLREPAKGSAARTVPARESLGGRRTPGFVAAQKGSELISQLGFRGPTGILPQRGWRFKLSVITGRAVGGLDRSGTNEVWRPCTSCPQKTRVRVAVSSSRRVFFVFNRCIHLLRFTFSNILPSHSDNRVSLAKKRALATKCDMAHRYERERSNLEQVPNSGNSICSESADGARSVPNALFRAR